MWSSHLLTRVFIIAFCAAVLYFGSRRVTTRTTTQLPPFNERLSKQLHGLCYTTYGVGELVTPNSSQGVATVVWKSHLRLSYFLKHFSKISALEEWILRIFLAITNNSLALQEYDRSIILNTSHCTESVLGDLVLSSDIRQVHFLYDVDSQWNNGYVSTVVSNDLFKCHTTLLQVLARHLNSGFEVFFHLSDSVNNSDTKVVPIEEQRPEVARKCTITLPYKAENNKHVTIRILEMIANVFHKLYYFKYYYVL